MAYSKRRIGLKRSINIGRVISKIAVTLISLWVGGTILSALGDVMNQTESAFYSGLTLIGWTVGAYPSNGTNWSLSCDTNVYASGVSVGQNCITDVSSGTGILGVIGIIGLASVVMEFVEFRM